LLILKRLIFESSVRAGRPNLVAAPDCPEIRPLVSASAASTLGTKRKHDFEPYWQDEKDWLCTVGFLPTDDPEARLYSADIIGYLVGYADLSNTRALALLGDPDASAYELLFSFSTPEEGPVPRSGPLT
jgi:hypothetical protein